MKSCILFTILVCIGAAPSSAVDERPMRVSVEIALELFLKNGPGGAQAAQSMLRRLSHEEIINQSLAILRRTPSLDDRSRRFIYDSLTSHSLLFAVDEKMVDELIALFSEGLKDSGLRATCLMGLTRVPPGKRGDAAGLLLTDIENRGFPHAVTPGFLNGLARWGSDARLMQPILPEIEHIFQDPQADDAVRGVAGAAMLCIGPVERALAHLEQQDVALSLGPIGAAGYESDGTFRTDEQSIRARLRQLVLKGLQSADLEVRTHAFEALAPAYGVDFLVSDGQGGFRADPAFVEALEVLVANEMDASLRERAQFVLATMDERVRKAIRKRNKRAESATPEGN